MTTMKDKIKRVAVDLFFKKGYFATSISEIAKGCDIRKASIYYHYSGKEVLLLDIMQTTMQDLLVSLQKRLSDAEEIEASVRAAVRNHVRFHLRRQKETFIASSELRGLSAENFKVIAVRRDEYERIFQDLIGRGIDDGIFADGDIKILSYAILTLCTAGASWFRPEGRLSVEQIAEIYENFVINGLKSAQWASAGPKARAVC